jgi:predicted dehydrogenase
LLTQSLEQLYGVEVLPFELPEDPQAITRILRAHRLGGLVVCAPLFKRICLIRKALDEGLPVLAETPMATELESVASLLEERSQRPGPPLLAIAPWRFAPDLQLARGILSGGALGDPIQFQITMPGPEYMLSPGAARLDAPLSAAGVVMQQGWLALDLVRHLIGDVMTVQATRVRSASAHTVLEGVEIAVQCGNGWPGKVCLSVEPMAPKTPWVTLKGVEGTVELGWQSSSFTPADGDAARIGKGCFGMENYERMANAFADVASFRVDPWLTDSDLIRTIELVLAAHMSLGAGLAVEAPRRLRRIVAS